MELNSKRFLITGGAGLMGSHIADRLIDADVTEVILLDNFVRGSRHNITHLLKDQRVRLIEGDIRDIDLLMKLSKGIDGIFHMAALRITACAADPQAALETMLMGTHNVLRSAVTNNVEKLMYASSASVYGMADTFPTEESHHPYNNRTYYGAAKVAGEGMARAFADMNGLNYVALRYFNVYGPRMDIHGKYTEVIIRWLDKIDANERPIILGDGSQTMDMVYIDDITDANILAMKSDITDEVFNVASGTETSLLDLLRTLLMINNCDLKPEYLPERDVNPVPRRLASTKKATDLLGFKAKVGLEEGLEGVCKWRRDLLESGGTIS